GFPGRRAHGGHVPARAERAPGAGEEHGAHLRVLGAAPEVIDAGGDHRVGKRVQLLGAVEGERRQPVRELEAEIVGVGRHRGPPPGPARPAARDYSVLGSAWVLWCRWTSFASRARWSWPCCP